MLWIADSSIKEDIKQPDKQGWKAHGVAGDELDSIPTVWGRRTLCNISLSIMDTHLLHSDIAIFFSILFSFVLWDVTLMYRAVKSNIL